MTSLELPKSRELCLALMFIFETFFYFCRPITFPCQ